MLKIMSDNDVLGHFERIVVIGQSARWIGVWKGIQDQIVTFAEVNLEENSSDEDVWKTCQENNIVLVTGNRSGKESGSLEETIRNQGTSDSLPVVTLADSDRILHDSSYADRAIEKLLEYLLDLDNLKGAGRLYIP